MKIRKENKVDELADLVPIAAFPVTSLSKLRSFLNAARLGLMHAQAPLTGYSNLLKSYLKQTSLEMAKYQPDSRTANYLKQLQQLVRQAIKDAKQAELYLNNPIQLLPDLGLGDLEDEFKMAVVDEWIRHVQGDTKTFDGNECTAKIKKSQQYKGLNDKKQRNVWLFVACFIGLKAKLAQEDVELAKGIEQLNEVNFFDLCRKLIPIINKEFDDLIKDVEDPSSPYTQSAKKVETIEDDKEWTDDY